jgi:hypothetical protein
MGVLLCAEEVVMKFRSKSERKTLDLKRDGEPEGAECQVIIRAMEIRGVRASNRYAHLSARWKRIVNSTWR